MYYDTPAVLADPEVVARAACRRLAKRRGEAWHVVEWGGGFCIADDEDWICYWRVEDGAEIVYTALPSP